MQTKRRSFFSFSATSVGVREVANRTSAAIPNLPPRVINGVNWQRFSVNDGSESVLKKRSSITRLTEMSFLGLQIN